MHKLDSQNVPHEVFDEIIEIVTDIMFNKVLTYNENSHQLRYKFCPNQFICDLNDKIKD